MYSQYYNACVQQQMEKRTLRGKEGSNSHDLLHLICTSQDSANFIQGLKSHKLTEKCRVLEERMHQNYKSTPSRHVSTMGKRIIKGSQHLVKHQNKIQANIRLHQTGKFADTYLHTPPLQKITVQKFHSSHGSSYFVPKTRQEILREHQMGKQGGVVVKKRRKNESIFSIGVGCEGMGRNSMERGHVKGASTSIHTLEKEKENMMKFNSTLEVELPSQLNSKSNSFSTFSNIPSHLYVKQKQELASLDQHFPLRATQISGFTRHQLFGYYKSLISFSKGGINKYLTGFQTMLNLMNISTNENTIKQLLSTFILKPSFQEFTNVFVRIVESALKQSVVDYFEIVLDGKWGRQLCADELVQLLSERMSNYHAKEIVEEIYFNLEKQREQRIAVQEIVGLCYQNEQFCSFMRGYCQETNRKRVSQQPRTLF